MSATPSRNLRRRIFWDQVEHSNRYHAPGPDAPPRCVSFSMVRYPFATNDNATIPGLSLTRACHFNGLSNRCSRRLNRVAAGITIRPPLQAALITRQNYFKRRLNFNAAHCADERGESSQRFFISRSNTKNIVIKHTRRLLATTSMDRLGLNRCSGSIAGSST